MTKFEEEFDNKAEIFDVIGNHNSMCCEVDQVKEVFKDWQPQQALPVVPEYIGKLINNYSAPKDGEYINYAASYPENKKELDWIDNHQKTWLTALLVGFTIEKPQLFYLKNKITGLNLVLEQSFNATGKHVGERFREFDMQYIATDEQEARLYKNTFSKAEIDSMQTGSYEQIEVVE